MKKWLLILLCLPTFSYAQDLHGILLDSADLKPIPHAKVIAKGFDVYSNEFGRFTLKNYNKAGKRFSVRTKNYKTVEIFLETALSDTLKITLHLKPFQLREAETRHLLLK